MANSLLPIAKSLPVSVSDALMSTKQALPRIAGFTPYRREFLFLVAAWICINLKRRLRLSLEILNTTKCTMLEHIIFERSVRCARQITNCRHLQSGLFKR
jgi:hypothetical protein